MKDLSKGDRVLIFDYWPGTVKQPEAPIKKTGKTGATVEVNLSGNRHEAVFSYKNLRKL